MTHPLLVLNTSIATADGDYRLRTITLAQAQRLAADHEIDSAVGHESTAAALTEMLGVDIPVNRQQARQRPGQRALVFKINGRPPEGAVLDLGQLEDIGYTLKAMERTGSLRDQHAQLAADVAEAEARAGAAYETGELEYDAAMHHAWAARQRLSEFRVAHPEVDEEEDEAEPPGLRQGNPLYVHGPHVSPEEW